MTYSFLTTLIVYNKEIMMIDFDRLNDNWKMYEGNPLEGDDEEEKVYRISDPDEYDACN